MGHLSKSKTQQPCCRMSSCTFLKMCCMKKALVWLHALIHWHSAAYACLGLYCTIT